MRNLEELIISGCEQFRSRGLDVSRLESLVSLCISSCDLSQWEVREELKSSHLSMVDFSASRLPEGIVEALVSLPSLSTVHLADCEFPESPGVHITGRTESLSHFNAAGSNIRDVHVDVFCLGGSLRILDLSETGISSEAIRRALKASTHLGSLRLDGCDLSSIDWRSIDLGDTLNSVSLQSTNVSGGEILELMARHKNLYRVSCRGCPMSPKERAEISRICAARFKAKRWSAADQTMVVP